MLEDLLGDPEKTLLVDSTLLVDPEKTLLAALHPRWVARSALWFAGSGVG